MNAAMNGEKTERGMGREKEAIMVELYDCLSCFIPVGC